MPNSSTDLVGQFILCKAREAIPAGWAVRQNGPWYLGSHPLLPVVDIHAADSAQIGWLLGWAIGPDGRFLNDTVRFSVQRDAPGAAVAFERALYEHGGRFAAWYFGAKGTRLYLDPCGTLAAVFCPSQCIASSTSTLVPYSALCQDDDELIATMGLPETEHWYPFGLTGRIGVERLLPNHYLDLQTWQAVRHWPKKEIAENEDVAGALRRIASILKTTIAATARERPLYMSLTAGRDSRMLLACAREHIEKIAFFTFAIPGPIGQLDCEVARRLARRAHLSHTIVPVEIASQTELEQWLHRTGRCAAGWGWKLVRTYERLDRGRPVLLGAAGEVCRGFHWRKGDTPASDIAPGDLIERLELPTCPRVLDRAGRWLDSLPVRNALTIWGLLYLEDRMGSWGAPQEYGHVMNPFRLWPYSHRGLLETMLSLPVSYRRENRLPEDLIKSEWPELLCVPFNWPIGFKRYLSFIRRHANRLGQRMVGAVKGGAAPGSAV